MLRSGVVLALLAAVLLATAGPASAATRDKLASGPEIGAKWRVTKTSQLDPAELQGISTEGMVETFSRTYKRRAGGRPEKLTVLLHAYSEPTLATNAYVSLRDGYADQALSGVAPFGEASFSYRFGKQLNGLFSQGAIVGSVLVARGKRGQVTPSKAQLGRIGKRVAAKVAATP